MIKTENHTYSRIEILPKKKNEEKIKVHNTTSFTMKQIISTIPPFQFLKHQRMEEISMD